MKRSNQEGFIRYDWPMIIIFLVLLCTIALIISNKLSV